jgi:hypothetical protein
MNLKNRLAKLESKNTALKPKPIYIHFHGVCGDGSEPELLGYSTTSRGKETRIMRLADESVHDFQCRCKDVIPIPKDNSCIILMAIHAW